MACLLGSTIATAEICSIYQYEDCDDNGTLFLHEFECNLGVGVDLSGLYLGCADVAGNFGGANMSGSDLTAAWMAYRSFPGVDWTGANLTNANMDGANIQSSILTNANLDGAIMNDVNFAGVYSGGIVGTPASYPDYISLINGYIVGPYVNLPGADLSGANLSGVYMFGVYMFGADLTGADLTGADLTNANLTNADLTGSILTNAILGGVSSGGIVGEPADLPNGFVLANGYLVGGGVDLTGADLSGADLTGAVIYGSNFTGADLTGADLSKLSGWEFATWIGATYDDDTLFPEGMDPDEYGMVFSGPPVTGACCLDDGTCSTLTEENCVDAGGTYNGDNSDCDTASCNTGACCFLKEFCYWECLELAEQDCMSEYAATWYGIGSRCDDITCPDPCVGACCLGGSQCVLTVQALCEAQEGTFHAYKMCDEIECECPGDLNGDGVVNILDLLKVINYWGACP
ncbi:MAG: pentapeptide repeat-containing protein [Phycisphaerales bacterium]|nr:pentapeptide repeat-containing protein [Phycisphaerales bacterium]